MRFIVSVLVGGTVSGIAYQMHQTLPQAVMWTLIACIVVNCGFTCWDIYKTNDNEREGRE